jgi:GTP-binding protein EngB required for normal cell division
LQARIQRLGDTCEKAKLLAELHRIITAHGLVEFRNTLADLLDRLEIPAFRIGVFGRVSAGKSSLLNYLLEGDFLPVGVTPVTAVPTRISRGALPQAIIEFIGSEPTRIDLSRLAEFSTEQQNPGNTKHVARIEVEVPARRLHEGVTIVDTPGLGSLATAGAEEAMAYLPKCDLGIVLVDAGSALSHEDLVVVQSLLRAGATVTVLVSKADLLGPEDRERTLDYVRRHFNSEASLDVPVHPVSVIGAHARLCEQWFEEVLKPLLNTYREASASSLMRKTAMLREAVIRALRARLNLAELGSSQRPDGLKQAAEALRGANAILETAERKGRTRRDKFREPTPSALHATAADIAAGWRDGKTTYVADILARSFSRFLGAEGATFVHSTEEARTHLTQILWKAHAAIGWRDDPPEELPKPAGVPITDPVPLAKRVVLRKPLLPGFRAWRHFAETRLSSQLGDELPELLNLAGSRLEQWQRNALEELRHAFDARAGVYRALIAQAQSPELGNARGADVQADLATLDDWQMSGDT